VTEQTQTNQGAGDEDEFYDNATDAFPSVEHLAPSVPPNFGDGRLVAIWALENGQAKSKTDGSVYGYTQTITLALDDGPNGDQINEMVGPAPFRVPMRHSTGYIHSKLKDRVTGKNQKGVPLRFRPYLGRVNTQVSKASKNQAAYGIVPATEQEIADVVMRHKALIVSINKELEAEALKAENDTAFE
jgi:hypothetical protein